MMTLALAFAQYYNDYSSRYESSYSSGWVVGFIIGLLLALGIVRLISWESASFWNIQSHAGRRGVRP